MKQLVYLAVTIVLLTGLLPGAAAAEAPTGPTLLEQLPNLENWAGVVGRNPSSAADDFVLAQAQTIAQVQLWSVPGTLGSTWTVVFHEDQSGLPGAQLGPTQSGLVPVEECTTLLLYGSIKVYLTTLTLPQPVRLAGGTYWIEIHNTYPPGFRWLTGLDDTSARDRPGAAAFGTFEESSQEAAWHPLSAAWQEVPTDANLALRLLGPAYDFTGFFSPVDNAPVQNQVKAGSAVPVKFSLGGDYGLDIFAEGYPKALPTACEPGQPVDAIDQTVPATQSHLEYDPVAGQYNYIWKTTKGSTGCWELVLQFNDDTTQRAVFKFK